MMFVSMSLAAGLEATNTVVMDPAAHAEMDDFGKMVVLSSTKTYAVRMAAVFMMSLATMWLKTGLMPRWLVGLSYLTCGFVAPRKRRQHVDHDGLPRMGAGGERLVTGPRGAVRESQGWRSLTDWCRAD